MKVSSHSKKIRILFIIPTTQIGGTETQILNIIKNINKKKFSVYLGILYSKNNQLKTEIDKIKNIDIIDFKKKNKFDLSIYFKIANFVKKNKIDIIQSFLGNHHSYLPALIVNDSIAIGGIRGTQDKEFSFIDKINEFTIPKMLTKLNKFNSISNSYAAKAIYTRKGFPTEKISVIPNGIDANRFSDGNKQKIINELSLNNKFVIGIVSRLIKEKNHETILNCFQKLLKQHKNLVLLIVGDGPERLNLERLTERLKIKKQVIFTGNRKDIRDLLSAMNIFVFPSNSEGWPNVVGEAMAAGLPVISYPTGDIKYIITNKFNGIISESTPSSLLYNIDLLIKNKHKREYLGKNAKQTIKNNFKINKLIKNYENLYLNIIKNKRDN